VWYYYYHVVEKLPHKNNTKEVQQNNPKEGGAMFGEFIKTLRLDRDIGLREFCPLPKVIKNSTKSLKYWALKKARNFTTNLKIKRLLTRGSSQKISCLTRKLLTYYRCSSGLFEAKSLPLRK